MNFIKNKKIEKTTEKISLYIKARSFCFIVRKCCINYMSLELEL